MLEALPLQNKCFLHHNPSFAGTHDTLLGGENHSMDWKSPFFTDLWQTLFYR